MFDVSAGLPYARAGLPHEGRPRRSPATGASYAQRGSHGDAGLVCAERQIHGCSPVSSRGVVLACGQADARVPLLARPDLHQLAWVGGFGWGWDTSRN